MKIPAIFKRVSVYLLATLISRGVGFILLPIYTEHLAPAEYGMLAVIDMIGLYFSIFVAGGLGSALIRHFDLKNAEQSNQVYTTIVSIVSLFFVIMSIFSILLFYAFSIESIDIYVFIFAILFFGLDSLNTLYFSKLAIKKEDNNYFKVCMVKLFIAVPLNIYFIVYLQLGVLGFIYANVASALGVILIYSLPDFIKNFHCPQLKQAKDLIKYSMPFIPNGLLEGMLSSMSIILLTYFQPSEVIGIFAIATKLASILLLTGSPLQNIWIPYMFSLKNDDSRGEKYSQGLRLLALALFSISLILIAFSGFLFHFLIDNEYKAALSVLPYLLISNSVYMLRSTARIGIALSDNVKVIPMITLLSIVLTLPIFAYLSYRYGATGAAIGQLILSTTLVIMLFIYSRRYIALSISVYKVTMPLVIIGTLTYLFELPIGNNPTMPILMIFCYLITLYLTGIFQPSEKKKINGFIQSRLSKIL